MITAECQHALIICSRCSEKEKESAALSCKYEVCVGGGTQFNLPWKDCLLFHLILHKGFNYKGQSLLNDFYFTVTF